MAISSLSFLGFFAGVAVVYYLIPHRFRWLLLLLGSLYFYGTFKVGYVALLAGYTLLVYLMSLVLAPRQDGKQKGGLLIVVLVGAVAPLLAFKYFNFFLDSLDTVVVSWLGFSTPSITRLGWLLPAGLSFFTFSCMSYLMDIYRGKLPAEKHLGRMALYVAFFPKILMGPIDRASTFLPQLLKPVRFNGEDVAIGLQMILWGLFKKMVIADRLVPFLNPVMQSPGNYSGMDLVIASYFAAFQVYCDFSGYSEIAVGMSRVLGIKIMVNFRRPFFSNSILQYWGQRWHISLTRWMRDYLYIPLGGNRVPKWRQYFNLMVVFLVSGLWHGAAYGFILWGALNGLYCVLTEIMHPVWTVISRLLRVPAKVGTLLSMVTVFHMHTVAKMVLLGSLLGGSFKAVQILFSGVWKTIPHLPSQIADKSYSRALILCFVLCGALVVVEVMEERWNLWEKLRVRPAYVRWPVYYAVALVVIGLGVWGQQRFVYMSF